MKFIDGAEFDKYLAVWMKPLLIKGAPSVIQDLKEFYNDSPKVQAIEKLLLQYLANMEKEMVLD